MAKTITNVLKSIAKTVSIGVSTSEVEPNSYTDLGFIDDAVLKVKMEPVKHPVHDGTDIQAAYECSVELTGIEVINISTIEDLVKNAYCWIKVDPLGTASASNPIIRVINFIANIAIDLDLSAKGKSTYKITGKKYCSSHDEFYTAAGS